MAVLKGKTGSEKPSIYDYHDYRVFLKDLLAHLRASKFSMRKIAKESGLTAAYISMVLKKQRNLSAKNIDKLSGPLGLNDSEKSFLKLLCNLADSESPEIRNLAYNKIKNFGNYKKKNINEVEVYKYLSEWYYVVIREMSEFDDFVLDPQWIQSKLQKKVSITNIKKAIKFLVDYDYINVDQNGNVQKPDKHLKCMGGIYRLSLGKFHQEMFDRAGEAFNEIPREKRNILGHTMAIPKSKVDRIKDLLDKTLNEVVEICNEDSTEDAGTEKVVYHVGLATFPLTKTNNSEEVENDS